jgi:hypothetical protein
LQNLFPRLSQTQLANLGGAQGNLGVSNSLLPNAGLTGSNVANVWLARVGATNQLAQSAAQVQAQGTMGQATAWGQALGGASSAIGSAIPTAWNTASGWLSPSSVSPNSSAAIGNNLTGD